MSLTTVGCRAPKTCSSTRTNLTEGPIVVIPPLTRPPSTREGPRAETKNDASKKNLQLKFRKLNLINTISYVQILGTGMDTQDTSPSVLLFFDNQRFIFNAGEVIFTSFTFVVLLLFIFLQIDHIFLSRVCSETTGGLPGLLLTLAGMGEEGMSANIWGPSDLKYLVDATRSFIPNAAMVHTKSFGPIFNTIEPTVPHQNTLLDPIVLLVLVC
ncbi:Zinc phosphodiesterase ELAC protein 2 [Spatholobus suberectus]|nr:Zinc phosphodiesterase ELAC protein 2 [Spatholobus suberectus]